MTSFQLSVTPHRRAAARFIDKVHRSLRKAYADSPNVTQTAIADALGVDRSVINRQMRGRKDMSLGRVAELAHLLGYEAEFDLIKPAPPNGCNAPEGNAAANPFRQLDQTSTTYTTYTYDPSKRLSLQLVTEDA